MTYTEEEVRNPDLGSMTLQQLTDLEDHLQKIVNRIDAQLIDPLPEKVGDTRWEKMARLSQKRYRQTIHRLQRQAKELRRQEGRDRDYLVCRTFVSIAKDELESEDFREMMERALSLVDQGRPL